jgi:PncC family amidohydrolase
MLSEHGAISEEVARAMATAARKQTGADVGVGITGVAGPEESEGKPVGTVYVALDVRGELKVTEGRHRSNRADIKRLATTRALNLVRLTLMPTTG